MDIKKAILLYNLGKQAYIELLRPLVEQEVKKSETDIDDKILAVFDLIFQVDTK